MEKLLVLKKDYIKYVFLLVGVLFMFNSIYCQELPTILPPSPNAASLGTYGQIPVGKFTGTIQASIPLYTFSVGKLNLPISLSYSSNGIKVDEIASNTGFGWVLNAGGVVTRTVYDDPDEDQSISIPTTGLVTQQMLDYLKIAEVGDGDGFDTKPDIFSFNFNGYSGKFFLDENKNPVLIEPSPLKIEILTALSNSSPLSLTPEIKITDPMGIIYWFGGGNGTEVTFNRSYGCGSHSQPSVPVETAWYLTKITHPMGEEINFLYDRNNYTYDTGISQTITKTYYQGSFQGDTESHCINKVYGQMSLLKEINSTGFGSVKFTYSTGVSNSESNYNKKLDNISIQDKNNVVIKEFNLEYQVFGSDLSYINSDVVTNTTDKNRLFLYKVTEKGKDGSLNPPYVLEYNHPEKLPPRFSYAQDYWGYFNGASSNIDLVTNEGVASNFNSSLINCDKNANGFFGSMGMLIKISYPTGGYHEFYYEPHTTSKLGSIYPPIVNKNLSVQTDSGSFGSSDIQQINNVPFNQNVYVNMNVMFNSYDNLCDASTYPEQWITATFTIKDLSNSQLMTFYKLSAGGAEVSQGTSINIQPSGMPYNEIYAKLIQGKSYELKLNVVKPCLYASASLSYYDQNSQTVYQNIEIGGVRIQKVISNDGKGNNELKRYYYATLNDLTTSSGIAETPLPTISHSEDQVNSGGIFQTTERYTISSSTLYPLYLMQGYHIGYSSVIEGVGNNFEGGGISNTYVMELSEIAPPPILGAFIPGTPYTNIFNIGKELEQKVFKKVNNNFVTLNSISNTYYHDTSLDKQITIYNVQHWHTTSGIYLQLPDEINQYNINEYKLNSQWHYLSQTVNTQYDENGLNPKTTTTNYYYDNPIHLQLTRKEVMNSKSELLKSVYSYANDLNNTELINEHRIGEVIKTQNFINSNTLSTQNNLYSTFVTHYLVNKIQTSKNNNSLEDRIMYNNYDNKGNPTDISKIDGTHVVYIWGYQQNVPIAKIENATYSQVSSYVSNLQTLSNADNDRTIGSLGNEGALRTALNNLRTVLPNAQISTYTYDPLIGITSITDPRGETIYYEYDTFNRLEYIKNADGKILNKNEYHYKNQ